MAATGLDVHLHPLVLINISDHVVRFRSASRSERVLGALLGAQEGRRIDVHNSFELVLQEESGERSLDLEFFQQRLAQYLEVFPRYEFLGWYSTGPHPEEADKALHRKIQEVGANENPFALLMDTDKMSREKASQGEDLPVKVYDATVHIEQGAATVTWNEVLYIIDTLEAERIAVNHVAKSATTATSGYSSDFTQYTSGLSNSVVMLSNRIKELLEHMKEVKEGRAPKNPEVLRQTLSICQALQSVHPSALQEEFCGEYNDATLVVLLATLTKVCANTSDLLDKFQLAYDRTAGLLRTAATSNVEHISQPVTHPEVGLMSFVRLLAHGNVLAALLCCATASKLRTREQAGAVPAGVPQIEELGLLWQRCAAEGDECACGSGHVRFGEGDRWVALQLGAGSAPVSCNISSFGEDPAFNRMKECWCAAPASENPQPARVAIVMLSRHPPDLNTWIRYHLHHEGVEHIFVRAEDSPQISESVQQLSAQDQAKVTLWATPSPSLLGLSSTDSRPVDDYTTLQARQTAAMARARDACSQMGIDWLIHIDDDELLYSPQSRKIGDLLAAVPSNLAQAALTGLLCECATSGDIAGLRVLIHAGAEVNAATAYDMRTPLHLAAAAGKLDVVQFLIAECGASLQQDRFGLLPIHDAVENSHTEVRRYLQSQKLAVPQQSEDRDSNDTDELMGTVFELVVKEGVFSYTTVHAEVKHFFQVLRFHEIYFRHFTPMQIAKHVHCLIAAKHVARATDDIGGLEFDFKSEHSGFFLSSIG
eukprot:s699_g13.t1